MMIDFRLIACAATALTFAACATTSPSPATSAAQAQAESNTTVVSSEEAGWEVQMAEAGDDDKICKKQPIAGSNFRRKVCATKEQWEAANKDGREAAETIQRRNRGFEPTR